MLSNPRDIYAFNSFINDARLIDLPLHDFRDFVLNKWRSYAVPGWAGFSLKEKFKLLKADLKSWNSQVFGKISSNIESQREEIRRLDLIDEVFGLDEQEVSKRNRATTLLLTELKKKNSLDSQKARYLWLRDGDCNSRFFHSYINRRRKRNEILGLNVNGEWQEKVEDVKRDKGGKVREMGEWEGDRWSWSWRWKRPLWDYEFNSLNALSNVINRFQPNDGVEDAWKWRCSTNGSYSTKETYSMILNLDRDSSMRKL
ncbi:hypothetical protein ACS0TY_029028 [Phlomoides rotata]